ncbi:uncharacterized protein LOC135838121 [Planococcus citri]|uniref:uncharacterized protein LOC135838121 n=1 Tax=Planococcus citri TaxID=170843 RepID=UPI0031F8F861
MFKVWLCFVLVNGLAYVSALHNFLPSEVVKKNVYTNFVPPSAERFFAPVAAAASVPSTKAAVAPQLLPAAANSPYLSPYASPYAYQHPAAAQYSPYAFKQYPYYPGGVFYPPQQFVYPGAVGPSPVVYVPRYPVPAESGSEQGGSSGGQGGWGSYFPSNWQSWGSNWGSYFPNWGSGSSEGAEGGSTPVTPAEGASSQGAAAPASSGSTNRGKPEKLESAEPAPTSAPAQAPALAPFQDTGKLDADKNSVTVELPEQQYVLLGQPQFFGHFAAFPADRDPTSLNGAAKGAVSSFLFYKDQAQQVAPQRLNDLSNVPGSASLAYQRFLLLSKQRSEDGPKPANKSETQTPSSTPEALPGAQKEISQSNSNSTTTANANANAAASASAADADAAAASVETSPAKASEDVQGQATQTQTRAQSQATGEIAQVTPNAVAYAGIGGVAGAAPVGTAYIANSGLASSAPRATAIAGTSNQSPDFAVVPAKAKTISIARYTPQRKYHIDTIPSSSLR